MTSDTSDLSDSDLVAFIAMAASLLADPLDLASVWMNESGFSPLARNSNGDASGLCQMMPETLKELGFWPQAPAADRARFFRELGLQGQLPWIAKYYAPARGRLTSATACYLWTFLPGLISHANEPYYVLAAKVGPSPWKVNTGYIYAANAGFDTDGDLKIEVRELGSAISRACRGARWTELRARLRVLSGRFPEPSPTEPAGAPDLGTWRGIQTRLAERGYLRSEQVDGLVGPITLTALRRYQRDVELVVDGVPGPATRKALSTT